MASTQQQPKSPWGTIERINECEVHRPSPQIDLKTGKSTGKIGCWNCGADLSDLKPMVTKVK